MVYLRSGGGGGRGEGGNRGSFGVFLGWGGGFFLSTDDTSKRDPKPEKKGPPKLLHI